MSLEQNILIATMGLAIGGAETHVIELSKGLADMGVSLFVASNGGAYETELAARGIPHFKAPLHNKKPGNVIAAYRTLEQIIIENDIKLVHAHARIPAFLCGMLQKKMDYRFRLVTTAHFNFINIFPYNILTNWGEHTLAVSADLADYLIKNYKTPRNQITVTVNGIDTERFAPKEADTVFNKGFGLPDDAVKVICVTRLDKDPSKIAPILAEAAARLYETDPKIRIIIIGDGNSKNAVRAAADAANGKIGEQIVILAGARTDIAEILPQADVFVGISRAALEAMACERPVILAGGYGYIGRFDESALDAALKTNFTCRGHITAAPDRLADDILSLLAEPPETREKLGAFGRRTVIERYSVARMCKDAYNVYDSVLAKEPIILTQAVHWKHMKPRAKPKKGSAENKYSDNKDRRNGVLLFGYYGSGNNGDDALLKSILDDLRGAVPGVTVTVLSRKPQQTAKLHNVSAIYLFNLPMIIHTLKNTKLLISGGGTLLQDVTSTRSLIYYSTIINRAKRYGAKVMLYANGLGPVRRAKNKERIKNALENVDCITLRDNQSLLLLEELGIRRYPPAILAADVAFSLSPAAECLPEYKGKKYFVAALRRWKYTDADFIGAAAAFCDFLYAEYGLEAVFLPMQPSEDTGISKKIITAMQTPGIFYGEDADTNDILALVKGAAFVFSMRLHAIIYAAKAYVPAIAVVYDPKVKAMMNILAQDTYVSAMNVRLETLKSYARDIMENRAALSARIMEKTREQTELARISIGCAARLLKE